MIPSVQGLLCRQQTLSFSLIYSSNKAALSWTLRCVRYGHFLAMMSASDGFKLDSSYPSGNGLQHKIEDKC